MVSVGLQEGCLGHMCGQRPGSGSEARGAQPNRMEHH